MSNVSEQPAHFPLLALPDPCLLAVLQCCAAEDQRSLLNAARAHSRLHKAATLALSSVNITVQQQRQANNVLVYLDRHGSHVNSLKLSQLQNDRRAGPLHHMPSTLQLHILELSRWPLQLAPGNGFEGVLGAAVPAPPLKQLQLDHSYLLDGTEGLESALLRLPALEHLCLRRNMVHEGWLCFPTGVQQLQQLTYLELNGVTVQSPDPASASPALQLLTALTRLADLRVIECRGAKLCVTASMLAGMCHLTRLVVNAVGFQPAALAGKAKLQHLELVGWGFAQAMLRFEQAGGAAGVAQMLSQLQQQTQLTHLNLEDMSGREVGSGDLPAAAYTDLTASYSTSTSAGANFLPVYGSICSLSAGSCCT